MQEAVKNFITIEQQHINLKPSIDFLYLQELYTPLETYLNLQQFSSNEVRHLASFEEAHKPRSNCHSSPPQLLT